jgi:ankyrin repeat protein
MPLTPLMKAAKEENLERVKQLLKDGADGMDTNEGFTALHYATSFNAKNLKLIQFLLEKYPALLKYVVICFPYPF